MRRDPPLPRAAAAPCSAPGPSEDRLLTWEGGGESPGHLQDSLDHCRGTNQDSSSRECAFISPDPGGVVIHSAPRETLPATGTSCHRIRPPSDLLGGRCKHATSPPWSITGLNSFFKSKLVNNFSLQQWAFSWESMKAKPGPEMRGQKSTELGNLRFGLPRTDAFLRTLDFTL